MRLDRSLTTAVFHPLQRAGWGLHTCRLPILMYHSVTDQAEFGVPSYYKTNTSPTVFQQHMDILAEEGYRTIDLPHVIELLGAGQLPQEKCVVITFDDGFKNFRTEAFPILSKHKFTATVFLPTAFISRSFKETACLDWSEVRELRQAGMHFGSHTVNHPRLVELKFPEIELELRDSKTELEQQLAEPARTFAYPYAFPEADKSFAGSFRKLLIKEGYSCCLTTELGRIKAGDDPYRLKRLPANSDDDARLFRAKLDGAYDWLAAPQKAFKRLKRRLRPSAHPKTLANSVATVTS